MSLLDEIMENNAQFVMDPTAPLAKTPRKGIAIFTCMDTRLVEFLEPAMGIGRGDAKVIKNAGTTVIDPEGGVIRSLVVAVHALGCDEICVIGHLDCGMSQINEDELRQKMIARGVPPDAIERLKPSLHDWLGAFQNPHMNVRHVVEVIRSSPLIPMDVPIHGLMFDPDSGKLDVLINGNRV